MAGRLRFTNRRIVVAALDPDLRRIYDAMAPTPDAARQGLIGALVRGLKASGFWARLDMLQFYAAHAGPLGSTDHRNALINWISPGVYDATLVNNPNFLADRGIAGDGTASYINTGFNPATAIAPKYQQDNACFGVWQLGDGSDFAVGIPTFGGGTSITPIQFRLNQGTAVSSATGVSTGNPHQAVNRSGPNSVEYYQDGLPLIVAQPRVSIAPINAALSLGRSNTTYSSTRMAGAYAGAGLTAGQFAALHAALLAYMTAVGAA